MGCSVSIKSTKQTNNLAISYKLRENPYQWEKNDLAFKEGLVYSFVNKIRHNTNFGDPRYVFIFHNRKTDSMIIQDTSKEMIMIRLGYQKVHSSNLQNHSLEYFINNPNQTTATIKGAFIPGDVIYNRHNDRITIVLEYRDNTNLIAFNLNKYNIYDKIEKSVMNIIKLIMLLLSQTFQKINKNN
jgi:hypothetical protein